MRVKTGRDRFVRRAAEKTRYMTMTGVMAALITVMTAFICHIPTGVNGGYMHFGDALIYLAAALLPPPYALAAAAIGAGLADLMTAPMWTFATVIIKMMIVLLFTTKGRKIMVLRNIVACILAYFVTGIGYFFAEYLIFETKVVFLVTMAESLLQSGGSALVFLFLGTALDKAKIKQKFFG